MYFDADFSGEQSIQIQFTQEISEKVNRKVLFAARKIEGLKKQFPHLGIKEVVPCYCSVAVYFSSRKKAEKGIKKLTRLLNAFFKDFSLKESEGEFSGKTVEIPVCYENCENSEFSPDLREVAKLTGLSVEEVISLHSSIDYPVYMMGFLPGFPYLGGMNEKLEVPRRSVPRTKIPAGSVAIGGKQTGVYPSDSPGGWQIIGRTPLKLFDINRKPPVLYGIGDRIRFVPVSREEFINIQKSEGKKFFKIDETQNHLKKEKTSLERYVCSSSVTVIDGGFSTTVQDSGTSGFQKIGAGESGAEDWGSYILSNLLCGNRLNESVLETTLKGPVLKFNMPAFFAITGADCSANLDGNPVPINTMCRAEKNSILKCDFCKNGIHSYIAFKGGILVPSVFSSRSTNTKSHTGGFNGRKIAGGDCLALGEVKNKGGNIFSIFYGKYLLWRRNCFSKKSMNQDVLFLECVKGSQFDFFTAEEKESFVSKTFTVSSQKDRMGIRFEGEGICRRSTDIISDSIPFGAVQITSSGMPVVMSKDRQTCGGYAKIAAVRKRSMDLLVQSLPGTKIRFTFNHLNLTE